MKKPNLSLCGAAWLGCMALGLAFWFLIIYGVTK